MDRSLGEVWTAVPALSLLIRIITSRKNVEFLGNRRRLGRQIDDFGRMRRGGRRGRRGRRRGRRLVRWWWRLAAEFGCVAAGDRGGA